MIYIIACVGKNLELGWEGDLVFHLKEDMQFFRKMTVGHSILMGSKTFFSLPGVLPDRTNYVLTRHPNELPEGAIAVLDLEKFLKEHAKEEIFVIGGAEVYQQVLPFANILYLTEVEAEAKADVYFPHFDVKKYDKIILKQGAENNIKFVFAKYTKKK